MRPVVLLLTAIIVLAVACDDPTPTPTPTPLIPHPTLAPPLTWDIIDDELSTPSSTWRKEHLFRMFTNALQSHDTELKKYDNKILTIEGPYSHRTETHTIHLQWPYLEHTFTINCGISPRPNASQFAYLDSIQQNAPTMTVRGELLYKPGQIPGFYYLEWNANGGFNVYLDLVYKRCQILTVDGSLWPPLPPITPAPTPTATPDPVVTLTATPVPKPSPTPTATPVSESSPIPTITVSPEDHARAEAFLENFISISYEASFDMLNEFTEGGYPVTATVDGWVTFRTDDNAPQFFTKIDMTKPVERSIEVVSRPSTFDMYIHDLDANKWYFLPEGSSVDSGPLSDILSLWIYGMMSSTLPRDEMQQVPDGYIWKLEDPTFGTLILTYDQAYTFETCIRTAPDGKEILRARFFDLNKLHNLVPYEDVEELLPDTYWKSQ